jgi:hypothetical protein
VGCTARTSPFFFIRQASKFNLSHNKALTMMKEQIIEQLKSRSTIIATKGQLLEQYKLYGDQKRKRYYSPRQEYEKSPYNDVQNFIYKRALFGLSVYNKTEISKMHFNKKSKINRIHQRTQKELNIWKQLLIIKSSNKFLELFPNSPIAQEIIKDSKTDPLLSNNFTFGDLGIKKEHVVERLYEVGVLPRNFYEINKNENKTKAL